MNFSSLKNIEIFNIKSKKEKRFLLNIIIFIIYVDVKADAANVIQSQIDNIVGSTGKVTMVTNVDPEVAMAAIKAVEETALHVVSANGQELTEDQVSSGSG